VVEEVGLEDLRATRVGAKERCSRRRRREGDNDSKRHTSITYSCIINTIVIRELLYWVSLGYPRLLTPYFDCPI
jgi:hypothetical protein